MIINHVSISPSRRTCEGRYPATFLSFRHTREVGYPVTFPLSRHTREGGYPVTLHSSRHTHEGRINLTGSNVNMLSIARRGKYRNVLYNPVSYLPASSYLRRQVSNDSLSTSSYLRRQVSSDSLTAQSYPRKHTTGQNKNAVIPECLYRESSDLGFIFTFKTTKGKNNA